MKLQPNRNYKSDDVVMTPKPLAEAILNHFHPLGKILEPYRGAGAFMTPASDWCEISEGRDFLLLDNGKHYDWIITNPPWSKIRDFLTKSFEVADNVVFLMTVNHAFTKARIRLLREKGFGIKEILFCDMPKDFPQSGFQLGAVHYQRGYTGLVEFNYL